MRLAIRVFWEIVLPIVMVVMFGMVTFNLGVMYERTRAFPVSGGSER